VTLLQQLTDIGKVLPSTMMMAARYYSTTELALVSEDEMK